MGRPVGWMQELTFKLYMNSWTVVTPQLQNQIDTGFIKRVIMP